MFEFKAEISKQEQQDCLKKLLHQNGMCLMIYPEVIKELSKGSNTSLLTALAETIHTIEQTLHQKLIQKIQHDAKNFSLPRRLAYIYDDLTIIGDFKKHPQIVKFSKIILELFSVSTERRINLFSLVSNADTGFNLTCLIINQSGYEESINIARIANKYYNIKQRNEQSKHELSLEDVFRSPHQSERDQLTETYKSQVNYRLNKNLQDREQGRSKPENFRSAAQLLDDVQETQLNLRRAKSSMPYTQNQNASKQAEYDGISLGDRLELRQDAQLINQCSQGLDQNSQGYTQMHQNPLMMMSPEQQMYYMYYQNSYYAGKSENYLNYQQHNSMQSPSKIQPYKNNVAATGNNYYANNTNNYPNTNNNLTPLKTNQNKRYTGRLKFFDDAKNYGFIIMDADQSDIFVHYDDLQKAGISRQIIRSVKNEMYMQIRFSFKVMEYFGKYKNSRKAVELIIIDDNLGLVNTYPLPTE